jgi:hypothetical protein
MIADGQELVRKKQFLRIFKTLAKSDIQTVA